MPRFSNFNGNFNHMSNSEQQEKSFKRVRQKSDNESEIVSKLDRCWAEDFAKCSTKEDFEEYISVNSRNKRNPFIMKAKDKIEKIKKEEAQKLAEEKAKESAKKLQQPINNNTYYNPQDNSAKKKNDLLYFILKVVGWLIVIGVVGIVSYSIYQSEKSKKEKKSPPIPTPVITDPSPVYPEPEPTPSSYEDDYPEPEPTPEPAKKYKPCNLCYNGFCGVCGGTGQVFSVFDGEEVVSGRMTECGNCGGSGTCPQCEGTGWIEDFSW